LAAVPREGQDLTQQSGIVLSILVSHTINSALPIATQIIPSII
jgi:hypothetical protein